MYPAELFEHRVGLHLVFGRIVRYFFGRTGDLAAEFRIDHYRGFPVFAFHQTYELVGGVRVFRLAGTYVQRAVHGLCTYDLAGRSHQRRKTRGQTNLGDQFHGVFEDILGLEGLELGHHIGVHTAGYLRFFHQQVRGGESEVSLDLLANLVQFFEIFGVDRGHSLVDQGVGFGRNVVHRERFREFLHSIECLEFLTDPVQAFVDLGHRIHVDIHLDTHFLGEHVDQFYSRGSRAAGKVPDVGIDDVHPGSDSGHYGRKTVTRSRVRVEIHRNGQVALEQFYQFIGALGRDQAAHVLDGDHIGAQSLHLFGFVQEIFVGEDLFRGFRAAEHSFDLLSESHRGILRIDGVAYGAIGDTAVFADVFHRRFDVVHVVQRVENTHDAQPGFDRVAAEAFDDLVGVRRVTEQVAPAGKGRQFGYVADLFLDRLQTRPGIFAQVTHYRIRNGAAPYLHGIELGIFVITDNPVDLLLAHAGRKCGLLAVAQGQVTYKKFPCHNCFILNILRFYIPTTHRKMACRPANISIKNGSSHQNSTLFFQPGK